MKHKRLFDKYGRTNKLGQEYQKLMSVFVDRVTIRADKENVDLRDLQAVLSGSINLPIALRIILNEIEAREGKKS